MSLQRTPAARLAIDSRKFGDWAKLLRYGRIHVDKFISLIPKILIEDDRMAVHRMRVTSRRVEQILSLLYPKPRPKHIRNLRHNVKRCRHALGELRDCDVLLSLSDGAVYRAHSSNDAEWEAVREYLQARRSRIAPAIARKVGRIKLTSMYSKFRRDLDSDGSCFGITAGNERVNSTQNGPTAIRRRIVFALDSHWRTFEATIKESRREPHETIIHGVRIATKRLRFLIEVMEELDIPGSPDVLAWLRSLQQAIGTWHDMVVLEQLMTKMISHRKTILNRRRAPVQLEKLIQENRQRMQMSEAIFSRMTLTSKDYRKTRKWVAAFLPSRQLGSQLI